MLPNVVFLNITFAVYDQVEIMHNQKHHVMCKNVMFTMSKHRVHLPRCLLKLHRVIAFNSK